MNPLYLAETVNGFGQGVVVVPDAKRLKELEAENGRLKRLLAESILDAEALKAALGRKC